MKNKLYHRILAVVLTVAMTMTSLPAAAAAEMANDVSASVSSAQMSDTPEEAMPNAEAAQSEASLGNASQEPEQSQESLTPSLEDTQDEQVAPAAEITAPTGIPISSAKDLQGINNNLSGSYYLTQNISLLGVSFTPLGSKQTPFTGTFDGNGYKITNLTIDSEDSYQGLFSYIGENGTVKNVGVTGSVSGDRYVGGIAGEVRDSGTIKNCYSEATVSSSFSSSFAVLGGVAGAVYQDASVINCYNTGAVSSYSDSYVGGVVGDVSGSVINSYNTGKVSSSSDVPIIGGVAGSVSGSVSNSYNTGSVFSSSSDSYVGGIAGYDTGSVSNCYNTGVVTGGGYYVGGAIGEMYGGSVSNCYYNTDNAGNATRAVGSGTAGENVSGLTTDQMSGSGALNQMQFTDPTVWVTLANAKNSDGSIKTYYYPQLSVFVADPQNPQPWEMPSTGVVDPTAILISTAAELQAINNNLSGNYVLANDIDLSGFAFTPIGGSGNPFTGTFDGNGHKVTNLTIGYNSSYYQGLFSYVKDGTVKNVGVTGSVSGKDDVGGIVGYLSGGIIENCTSEVTVRGDSGYVGGVVGTMDGKLENCYSIGTVTGDTYVGGIVGYVTGSVSNCYNTGKVFGSSHVGGVAGLIYGSVIDCYNTGAVTGNDVYTGGVAGSLASGTVSNCYYNKDNAGNATKAVAYGTAGANVAGLTTAQMSGSDALNQMQFTDPTAWVTLENAKNSNGTVKTYYYPQLSVFVADPQNPQPEEMPSTAGVASTAGAAATAARRCRASTIVWM